jgi:hypothetical protein
MEPLFGIEAFASGQWRTVAKDNKPLLFKTEAERDEYRKQLRKTKVASNERATG